MFVSESIFIICRRAVASNKGYFETSTLLRCQKSAESWVKYFGPMEPELTFTLMIGCLSIITLNVLFAFDYAVSIKQIKRFRYSLIFYLWDREAGKIAIMDRLDHYIEMLKMSNRNYLRRRTKKRPFVNQAEIVELNEELMFLEELKYDKSSLWPGNRVSSWIDSTSRVYIKNWMLATTFYLLIITSLIWAIQVNRIKYITLKKEPNYWNPWLTISYFAYFIASRPLSDYIAMVTTSVYITMLDNIKLMKRERESVENFLSAVRQFRFVSYSHLNRQGLVPIDSRYSSILKTKCNRLALTLYIRLRYVLDACKSGPEGAVIYQTIGLCAMTITASWVLYSDLNPFEWGNFVTVIFLEILTLNMIMITYSVQRSYSFKVLHRSANSIISNLLSPTKLSGENDVYFSSVSCHTRLLLERFTENHVELSERIAINVFGLVMLDYRSVIRMNTFVSYLLGFRFILRR